jgi:signal transduction histidine kinase
MIVAPIVVQGEIEGVLDIRSTSDELLEPEALEWTKIIVFMMSLLIGNQRQQAVARDNAIKAAKADKELRDAFEDLAHQMKSPLLEAQNQISEWLKRSPFQIGKPDTYIMRSLIDSAQDTTQLINLFAMFTSRKSPVVTRKVISPLDVAQVIDLVCANVRVRMHAQRSISISYDTEQALKHAPGELRMERRLLNQALKNLVDNAVKYSYSSTTISITCGRTGTGRFFISVRNRGIRVRPQDVRHMTDRGWRGGEAELAAEGSGLGLYIVKMIMELHGGWLDISHTSDTSGLTDVRLIFPTEQQP